MIVFCIAAYGSGLGEGGEIVFRQPGTEAQYCYKKLKLGTKSQIAFRLLELKLNRITKDDD